MLVTILILGILMGVATATWQNVAESRRVDAATNQLASDLRLAHTKATNRLENREVVLTSGGSTYRTGTPGGASVTRSLCGGACGPGDRPGDLEVNVEGVGAGDPVTVTFRPDGTASVTSAGAPTSFTVSAGGDPGNSITLTPATSEVRISS